MAVQASDFPVVAQRRILASTINFDCGFQQDEKLAQVCRDYSLVRSYHDDWRLWADQATAKGRC